MEGAVECGKDFENKYLIPLTSQKIDDYMKNNPTFKLNEARHKVAAFYITIVIIFPPYGK